MPGWGNGVGKSSTPRCQRRLPRRWENRYVEASGCASRGTLFVTVSEVGSSSGSGGWAKDARWSAGSMGDVKIVAIMANLGCPASTQAKFGPLVWPFPASMALLQETGHHLSLNTTADSPSTGRIPIGRVCCGDAQ